MAQRDIVKYGEQLPDGKIRYNGKLYQWQPKRNKYRIGGIHLCDAISCDTQDCTRPASCTVVSEHQDQVQMCEGCLEDLEKKTGQRIVCEDKNCVVM